MTHYPMLQARQEVEIDGPNKGKLKTVFYQGTSLFKTLVAESKQITQRRKYLTLDRITYQIKWLR